MVLVTGPSRGIGRAVAFRLAAGGANVAINFLEHEEEAADVCQRIQALGRTAFVIQADVSIIQ
jgi:3-oxoacyl-[acyl-carrier protein] reductase